MPEYVIAAIRCGTRSPEYLSAMQRWQNSLGNSLANSDPNKNRIASERKNGKR